MNKNYEKVKHDNYNSSKSVITFKLSTFNLKEFKKKLKRNIWAIKKNCFYFCSNCFE